MKHNYKYLYYLLSNVYAELHEREAYKQALTKSISKGRTDSVRELNKTEYSELIVSLETHLNIKEFLRKERSATLTMLQKHFGVDTTNWNIVDAICLEPRIAGKFFRYIKVDEHKQVRSRLYAMLRKGFEFKHRENKTTKETYIIIVDKTKTKKSNLN